MLTQADYSYLKRQKRDFKMNREQAITAFERDDVPTIETFVNFQVTYGGYRPEPDLTYGIVKPMGKYSEGPARCQTRDGIKYARCDINSLVQIRYWLGENGVFCFEDYPVAENFESYLRFNAYIANTLEPLGWTFIDHERRATKKFRRFLESHNTETIPQASDQYHNIRRGDTLFWIKRTHYDALYVRPDALKF